MATSCAPPSARARTPPAAADVHLAESYIAIQQLRYRSRAEFSLTSSGELEQWYLPHFTLQPLVENAIHYGVEDSDEVCRITVSAQAEGDTLTLLVHNTGTPVAPERLAEIRTFTVKPQGHGIGLKNIYERLSCCIGISSLILTAMKPAPPCASCCGRADLKAQNLPSDAKISVFFKKENGNFRSLFWPLCGILYTEK